MPVSPNRLYAAGLGISKAGITSFGGPVAHLGYFRKEFVKGADGSRAALRIGRPLPDVARDRRAARCFRSGMRRAGFGALLDPSASCCRRHWHDPIRLRSLRWAASRARAGSTDLSSRPQQWWRWRSGRWAPSCVRTGREGCWGLRRRQLFSCAGGPLPAGGHPCLCTHWLEGLCC